MSKFLVIGEFCYDIRISGDSYRLSPEAPVPILLNPTTEVKLGMAANVAANLVSLGQQVTFLSVNGTLTQPHDTQNLFINASLGNFHLFNDPNRPPIEKTRYIANGQQILRVDSESVEPLSFEIESRLEKVAEAALANSDALIIQDYGKGLLSRGLISRLLRLAKQLGKPSFVDPNKAAPLLNYEHAMLIKPNLEEGKALTGETSTDAIIETIMNVTGAQHVVLTLGKGGMIGAEKDYFISLPSESTNVVDVTGAGDTVLAVLAKEMVNGSTVTKATEIANIAAGIAVSKPGTYTITQEELK